MFASFEEKIKNALRKREQDGLLRKPFIAEDKIDFASNDYLGLSRIAFPANENVPHGATGSRLLTGNSALLEEIENEIAAFHGAEAALLFNSGYDANVGAPAALAGRNDLIFYDEYIHASLRDGFRLSFAPAFRFPHNDLNALEKLLQKNVKPDGCAFVFVESIYSMDGDAAPVTDLLALCARYKAVLFIDEAHALGVCGEKREGLAPPQTPIRLYTYGKAAGRHGAALVVSQELRNYLWNFHRPLAYSTALSPQAAADIRGAYRLFPQLENERAQILNLSRYFFTHYQKENLPFPVLGGDAAILALVVSGNERARAAARFLQAEGLDVRPVLSPTVPAGTERLRICLHSFNETHEIDGLIASLARFASF